MTQHRSRALPPRIGAATAITLAILSLGQEAAAQAAATERIEVTGSIIRRTVNDETALPVTTIRAEELDLRGHTELKDLMLELPQANSLGSFAGTAGPVISLRGLGPMRSLTLLNGRRLAKEPLVNQYTSLSVIPRMALERTEILRDGASSAYGSDAIGGVQAFYTMRSFEGLKVKLEGLLPEKSGGGDEQSIGVAFGRGNLARDGWNAYVAAEVQKRDALLRSDRPNLTSAEVNRQMGIVIGQGNNASPANFTDPTNPTANQRTLRFNPYFSAGCIPGRSIPSTSGGRQTCFLDTDQYLSYGNGNDITTLYAKGTLQLGADHQIFAEYNLGKYTVIQYNNPIPVTVRLTSTHPYYPGNGRVPAVAGLNLAGRPVDAIWSVDDLGPRIREDRHTNQRFVLGAEGRFGGFDYRAGINIGRSERDTGSGAGWTTITGIATVQGTATTLFLDPRLNPFGTQTAEGQALLESRQIQRTFRLHEAVNDSVDVTLTRELMNLGGGPLTLAVGAEARKDGWHAVGLAVNDGVAALNGLTDLLGGDAQATGARSTTENKITRDITSAFAELDMPVTKTLTLNASLRVDDYKDLGETTTNPKLALRWQPLKQLAIRGSANTGFRAPSIPEIYTKETERTLIPTFDDPVNCPTVNGVRTPRPGFNAADVCQLTNRNQITKVPGNSGVKPETSKSYTFGIVADPVKNLSVTVDFWHTQIDDVIGNRPIDFMLANHTLYTDKFRRNPDGTLASDAVFNPPSNVGSLRAEGVDVSVKYTGEQTSAGRFSGGIDIAYLTKWDAKSEGVNGGNWMSALGYYNDVVPVNPNTGLSNATRGFNNRWRHTAYVGWQQGAWKAQLSQRYQSKFRDQNSAAATGAGTSGPRDVAAYEQYNLVVEWSGIKNLKLGAAVFNLLDRDPPQTNHTGYRGYLTSSVDVLGRAYRLTAQYSF